MTGSFSHAGSTVRSSYRFRTAGYRLSSRT